MSLPASRLPYAGLTVLDLSQGIAGPECAVLLGRQGADVIKIEPPNGDWIRVQGAGTEGTTALTVVHNLGKRSLCLDLSKDAGREVVLEIARKADVLVENFRPGVMKRLGLDYATVAAVNPRLVYVSISGFGDSGPRAKSPATDTVLQALTGMAAANRDAQGRPQRVGVLVPDVITALYATQRIGAVLYQRDAAGGGKGSHVQLSLLECCAAFQAGGILDNQLFSSARKEPIAVPAGVFDTRDGHVVMANISNAIWRNTCAALGREDWLDEPRYATNSLRAQNAAELNGKVARILAQKTTAEWVERFAGKDVLFAPVQDYAQFRSDPQITHLKTFQQIAQQPFGTVQVPAVPGEPAGRQERPAPAAGQHNREILAQFGFDDDAIEALERADVLMQPR